MTTTRRELLLGSLMAPLVPLLPADDEPLYPDDAFSRPTDDLRPAFRTLEGVGSFLRVVDRPTYFARESLTIATLRGQARTRWAFTTRGLPHNALFIQDKIRRAPDAISVRIANRSDKPIRVELQAHELAWMPTTENVAAVWQLGSRQPLAAGEERRLVFKMSEARSDKRDHVRYPIVALVLLVSDLKPDSDYEILLSELTVHYPHAAGIRCRRLQCHVRSGIANFAVETDAGSSAGGNLDVEVRRKDRVYWRVRLTPAEASRMAAGGLSLQRKVPWYLPSGAYEVGLVSGGYRVEGPTASLTIPPQSKAHQTTGSNPLPMVQKRTFRGRPTVFVNGKPFAWKGYSSYDYQPGNVSEFGASGVNCFTVPVAAGRHIYPIAEQTWLSASEFDFSELDERICCSLQANPDAMIALRVGLAMPLWWIQGHEDELAQIDTEPGKLFWEEGGNGRVPSIASEVWLRDQERALRALIRHCRSQPWASRLIAIWLAGETTEEWFAWGSNDGFYSDYSKCMAKAFSSEAANSVPTPGQRKAPHWDVYPDTDYGRLAARYHGFISDLTARVIGRFARVVKDATGGRTLVCCFHGYVIELAGEPRQALSGHFGLQTMLADPNVDVIACVPLLDFRDLTNGYNPYCSATESILAAGKLVCPENDMFSWLHPLHWHVLYDPADPRAGAISMHQRECANEAVHGALAQKFSLAASWHHDAALQRAFAHQGRVYEKAQSLDRSPVEEVAFVVDDASFAWTPPESRYLAAAHKLLLRDLGRTGAPVGVWLLADIDRIPERIRFIVVASSYAATTQNLQRLERTIVNGGRTIWVIGAPGLVNVEKGRWNVDEPARLLSMPLRIRAEELSGAVVLTRDGRPVPSVATVCPRTEATGEGWLRYADGPCAGLERKLPAGGRLLWSGVPVIETGHLRRWLEEAGVHCYAPAGCFVHASRELVAITSPVAGEVPLVWPRSVNAEDLFDGWRASGRQFTCPFRAGQTRLFKTE